MRPISMIMAITTTNWNIKVLNFNQNPSFSSFMASFLLTKFFYTVYKHIIKNLLRVFCWKSVSVEISFYACKR